jgi:hypothetical protein
MQIYSFQKAAVVGVLLSEMTSLVLTTVYGVWEKVVVPSTSLDSRQDSCGVTIPISFVEWFARLFLDTKCDTVRHTNYRSDCICYDERRHNFKPRKFSDDLIRGSLLRTTEYDPEVITVATNHVNRGSRYVCDVDLA